MPEYPPRDVETSISQWAINQTNIRAVITIGSQARRDHPADEWSDLDLLLLIKDPLQLAEAQQWIHEISHTIGDVWSIAQEFGENSVWFNLGNIISGKLKVDLACCVVPSELDVSIDLEKILPNLPFAYIFSPSCRILYDPSGCPRDIPFPQGSYTPQIPDESELINACRLFWMELVHFTQLFNRGEYWRAMNLFSLCQGKYLLRLIECHSLLFTDNAKVWPRGIFLEEWADSRIVKSLQNFRVDNPGNSFREAVLKLFDLHDWIAREICTHKGISFPSEESDSFRNWLQDLTSSPSLQ